MQPRVVAQPAFSATVRLPVSATGIAALRHHAPGLGVLVAFSIWLTRHWLESSAPPAGTDMLGFISRAKQNAAGLQATSLWSPANWGARRAITLESLLGLMTRAIGDPVVAVKLFALATLLAAGVFAYLFALRLFWSRVAATCAGILYMSSQGMLAHLASGHLNVEVAIATMPLMLMLWCESLERFSLGGTFLLGGAAAFTVLARPDLALYVAPTMLVVVAVRMAIVPGWKTTLRNAVVTSGVALIVTASLSLYLIVPAVAGIRARWLTASSLFDPTQLINRSVGAYPSLLGFAREIGYLAFTGQQTWSGHPWLSFAGYVAFASCVVVLALGAAIVRPDAKILALLSAGVVATFMAKGLRAPFGSPFDWAVQHVPVFSNLRDPNRWLLPQALVFSLLAGGMLAWISKREGRTLGTLLCAAIVGICLVPVAPTMLTGLRTVSVTRDQRALLDRIARDPQPSLVASIPYDQTYRFVTQGTYAGWEHDLGSESFASTGHPAVGDGGWDQQAADTVAYTGTLLRDRSPAFAPILGSLGVKYVVSFGYAPTDPHLIVPGLGPLYQQRATAAMAGLEPVARAGQARLYRVRSFAPLVSFRPNIAVVLGGREGIGALAGMHGIDLRTWAVFTADDILAHGGVKRLLALARRARLLVVADASAHDLAVLSSTPVATLAGITSDPGLDQESQIVPSDASIRSGALASETAPVAQIGRTSSTKSFRLGHPRVLDLWARIQTGAAAGNLTFTIDGKRVRTIEPLTPTRGGFRWFHVARRMYAAGRHELAVAATPSAFGSDFELDEARLTVPAQTAKLQRAFRNLLAATAGHTLYAFDPAADQAPISLAKLSADAVPIAQNAPAFWRVIKPDFVLAHAHAHQLSLQLIPGRSVYSIAQHAFGRGLDWSGIDHLLLRVKGTGKGSQYRLVVDFNAAHSGSQAYTFTDDRTGWRLIAFPTPLGARKWSHVVSIRLAGDDRESDATLQIGAFTASRATTRTIVLPVQKSGTKRLVTVGAARAIQEAGVAGLAVPLTHRLVASGSEVVVHPSKPISQLPAVPVRFKRVGQTGYAFGVDSSRGGVLMLAQAFDPRWHATVDGHTSCPTSAFSLANAYVLAPGAHGGTIDFTGNDLGELGAGSSAIALIGLAGMWATLRRRSWA